MDDITPKAKRRRLFSVQIKYEAPYPKTFQSQPIEARSHERAVVFAYRAFKKTRPRKRMPKILAFRSEEI